MPLVAWIAVVIVAALAGSLTGVAFWFLKGVAATGLASKKARVIGKVIATAIAGCGVLAVTALFFIDWEKLMAPPAEGSEKVTIENEKESEGSSGNAEEIAPEEAAEEETPAEEAAEEETPAEDPSKIQNQTSKIQ